MTGGNFFGRSGRSLGAIGKLIRCLTLIFPANISRRHICGCGRRGSAETPHKALPLETQLPQCWLATDSEITCTVSVAKTDAAAARNGARRMRRSRQVYFRSGV